jgi:hypothetical protein
MNFSIADLEKEILLNSLSEANLKFQKIYPGDKPDRQAVHTVYGGANLFKADTCVKMGDIALKNLLTYSPDFVTLSKVLKFDGHEELPEEKKKIEKLEKKLSVMDEAERKKHPAWLAYTIYNKIIEKLKTEAVEDFRIDFEDGFGNRPDAEEDATAVQAANELADGMKNKTISPFIGIRIKSFTEKQGSKNPGYFPDNPFRKNKRQTSRQFYRDAAEGDDPRTGDHHGPFVRDHRKEK